MIAADAGPTNPLCLHHLFETQVDLRPGAPAIVCGGASRSYEEVDRHANQLARYLRRQGVRTGDLVGLLVDRSPDAIVAILSILKAGAAYVPLDPSHPPERIRHIVAEASIATLVSTTDLRARNLDAFGVDGVKLIEIDDPGIPWRGQAIERLSRDETGVAPSDLCYVLYTSGSTGRPKGVMTEHRNVVAFVSSFNEVLRLTEEDRVFQGFSLGFDGSVEEMWMAFSNGGALIVPGRGAARIGDDLALLVTSGNATVFSTVPTALATISAELATVRVLIVSGERCPKEAVRRWATPGRRMLNVYGPTETTVNATVAECTMDRAVTIGRALRGYDLQILDDTGHAVDPGEKGELLIAGPGVARGYLGQPELTRQHFVLPPASVGNDVERAYRTGDLVSMSSEGELLFHGRLDSQVKVRGYRIELSEIEGVLCEHPAIRTAVVTTVDRDGTQDLAAYVLTKGPGPGTASGILNRTEVLTLLTARLPTYMIPAFLDVVDSLPTLASGKVDRNRLPPPTAVLVRTDRTIRGPSDALEADLLRTFSRLLRNDSISIDDDFFLTLGGYSLLAAQLVSELRKERGLAVAIRDIYNYPTIAGLAACLRSRSATAGRNGQLHAGVSGGAPHVRIPPAASRAAQVRCAALQALGLYLVYGVMALPYLGTFLPILEWREGNLSFLSGVAIWLLISAGIWPTFLGLSVAAKWILIGRYKTGAYPVWGWTYFRFWLVRRFQLITGSGLLAGTPLLPLYLRAMGAKVGRGCTIDTPYVGAFDLLTIGDDSSVGMETQLLGYRVEDGTLFVGSIDIGNRCFVGIHCALGVGARMDDESRLDDQSLLPDGASIPFGESRRGSPARPAEVRVPEPTHDRPARRRRPVLFGLLHVIALYLVGALLIPTTIPGWALLWLAEGLDSTPCLIAALPVVGTVTFVTFCLWLVVLNQLILPSVRPGVYRVESIFYLRKWTADLLMQLSRALARPLYTTIYLPSWLRLLGAKIGRRAEISTVAHIAPKLTRIGDQSFFADGSMIGGRRAHRGLVELARSSIGRRSFVGNSAILPVGSSLGDDSLLGCLSAPPAGQKRTSDGAEWLGSPSFELRHRPKIGGFDRTVTHEPTRRLIAQRLLVDAFRIVLPSTLLTAAFVVLSELVEYGHERLPTGAWLLTVPLAAMLVAAGGLLCVVAAKKLLIGTFIPTVKPLWSMFVWLNEALNGTYETVATPVLTLLLGTPYAAPWLRLMGCKIGRNVYLETTLFSEFDLVYIGDDVALNAGAVIQNHLFEDRIMKISAVTLGDHCTVGNMAVVLYDTEMQPGSTIGPLSLLMKGETLPARTRWVGIPTAQVTWAAPNPTEPAVQPVSGLDLMERSL
jgi:non-ribosomal peptide synthetase-like protein